MENIWFQAAFLGLIEGLTEFLPVSSTGHLLLLGLITGFEGPPGKVFEITIQLGAILAVIWVYRHKFWHTTTNFWREKEEQNFVISIMAAFLPAAVIGFFAHSFIKKVLFAPDIAPWVVSGALLVGGLAILLIERFKPAPIHQDAARLSLSTSLLIGLCQSLAMIPGVSRSGATIMGALLLKVERKAAAEFSFFLAIPTMLAATLYDTYKNWANINLEGGAVILLGFVTAFITALLVVEKAIGFVSRHGFAPFAWYRIVIGGIGITYLLLNS